jgi:hypothetical protein
MPNVQDRRRHLAGPLTHWGSLASHHRADGTEVTNLTEKKADIA